MCGNPDHRIGAIDALGFEAMGLDSTIDVRWLFTIYISGFEFMFGCHKRKPCDKQVKMMHDCMDRGNPIYVYFSPFVWFELMFFISLFTGAWG